MQRNKVRHVAFRLAAAAMLAVLVLLSGCGTKRVEPVAVVEPDEGSRRVARWHHLMKEKVLAPEKEKLEAVNRFFNELEYVEDIDHWGRNDYWATPVELLRTNGGDCEDFATAKYFTLLNLAVPDEKMRLTYVRSLTLNKAHMVLTYYEAPDDVPLVLDSLYEHIVAATLRTDLLPVYSFNGKGLWGAKQRAADRIDSADRLSLWQDLLRRWQREAFAEGLPSAGR